MPRKAKTPPIHATMVELPPDDAARVAFVGRLAYLLTVMIVHDDTLREPPYCGCDSGEEMTLENRAALRRYRDRVALALTEALEDMQIVGVVMKAEPPTSKAVN